MKTRRAISRGIDTLHASPKLAATVAVLLLIGVGVLDDRTGPETSLTLFYLLPICIAAWFVGRAAGIALSVSAAILGLVLAMLTEPLLATTFWNAGVRFGVYLMFSTLLDHLKTHQAASSAMRRLGRAGFLAVASAAALGVAGAVIQRQFPTLGAQHKVDAEPLQQVPPDQAMASLAAKVDACMRLSRPVMLGSRDPTGPSCVNLVKTGDVRDAMPTNPGDWNGGPGTTIATLYYFDRQNNKSPAIDFAWHQHRLKTFLSNEAATNRAATAAAHELAEEALRFWESTTAWTTFPNDLRLANYTRNADWPSYCLAKLDAAVASRDLGLTRHWAGELAAATFSLDDLHRWLGFLVENHLTALEFQNRCQTLFASAEALKRDYDPQTTVSQFPAGVLSLNGLSNYYEVERQAERLFSMPPDRLNEITMNEHLTPGSLWMVPGVRKCFLKLQSALSAENSRTWELAARSPYQHSYLINMLYRAAGAGTEDELFTVLKKFDAINPHASVGELTGVLMYRGHSFAGLEWADRFQPELCAAADTIKLTDSDADALMTACQWTNKFYGPSKYGVTLTLRDALEEKRLDCVRATDMIGAIFRNAGRTRFGHVRWCDETGGHSVAAYIGTENSKPRVLLADGLNPPAAPEVWPDCYFHGHAWPPSLAENSTPYAMELYFRGLDSYIWADGYIVRGPNAGELTTASIPYSQHHRDGSTRKVFDGPYPQ